MAAYGGDEVNALVLDIGTSMTRAGYAGEDTPRVMYPTSVGYIDNEVSMDIDGDTTQEQQYKREYYIGDNKLNKFKSGMEIKNPMKEGIVDDWDAIEQIWNTTFSTMLRINPEDHPLLCTEPAWNTNMNREKSIELAFEKFNFPAFYLAKDAVMTAFSVGRATALVLNSGGGMTSAVPVYDGYVLNKGILRQPVGGDMLGEIIKKQLKESLDYTITPHYRIAKKTPVAVDEPPQIELRDLDGITNSFNDYQISRVLDEYKETICQVSEVTYDEGLLSSRPKKLFEFPDGFSHSFGIEKYQIPEVLFQPSMMDSETNEDQKEYLGVHEMVYNSINNCDVDLRPLLFNNVVVTGGNTLFDGFNERLNFELPLKAPGSKIKIHASGNTTERKSSSWLGGSILASLGTFHQLWISKKEYDEYGSSVIHRKC
ncbi:actin family [Pilobolus umbonatus]|nr:actin family [Pilobolus umbonatus]